MLSPSIAVPGDTVNVDVTQAIAFTLRVPKDVHASMRTPAFDVTSSSSRSGCAASGGPFR